MIFEILSLVFVGLIIAVCFVIAGTFLKSGEFGLFWWLLIVGFMLLVLFSNISGVTSVWTLRSPHVL